MGGLSVSYKFNSKGFRVHLASDSFKEKFTIQYPEEIWRSFPRRIRKTITENFVYLSTSSLASVMEEKHIDYEMNTPLLGSFFVKPLLYYIPFCSDEAQKDSLSILKQFMNTRYSFKSYNIRQPDYTAPVKDKAITLFTFGKDSLLSYALAEEFGMDPVPVYIEEPDIKFKDSKREPTFENKHKDILSKEFKHEFGKTVHKIKNNLGLTRHAGFFNKDQAELSWGSDLSEFALLSLPFNHHFKARYIIYGNEASCSANYTNKDGFLANPVFDQSREWNVELSKVLKLLTRNVSTVSLIEPIHDLLITFVLHNRYPQYAKYQTSCFAETRKAEQTRWCHACSKCARVYMLLLANNIDPKNVGFKENMLTKAKKKHFSMFGSHKDMKPYDLCGLGRDEMVLAFYLAHKHGAKGYLMDEFRRTHLKEAEERKDSLIKEYYGIHDAMTLPKRLEKKVKAVFEEERSKISFL